jgi:hypothetical protein
MSFSFHTDRDRQSGFNEMLKTNQLAIVSSVVRAALLSVATNPRPMLEVGSAERQIMRAVERALNNGSRS